MSERATETLDARGALLIPPEFQLLVRSGPDAGLRIDIRPGEYVIGSSPDCALVLTDPTVSRRHLRLVFQGVAVRLIDLGSKNGTFVEDARVTEGQVGIGVPFRAGSTVLELVTADRALELLPSTSETFGRLGGKSINMRSVFALLERISATEATVLVEGESGTGKELCAQAIHAHSRRASGPFVVCDLAQIPQSLIESDLFGHVRGAFTGAERNRDGAFAQADHGTIFLDEIGELDLALQPRLLRVLENRQIRPVGGTGYRDIDVRVVAATNRDLREEVRQGRFREDLYHRLAVVRVTLPPLRERKEDLERLAREMCSGRELDIPDDTLALLRQYDWPGNVRELRNVIERALALLGASRMLSPDLLGLETIPPRRLPRTTAPMASVGGNAATLEPFHEAKERLISRWEREYLAKLLERSGGNVSSAARTGGLDRVHLYRLLRKHGIDPGDLPPSGDTR